MRVLSLLLVLGLQAPLALAQQDADYLKYLKIAQDHATKEKMRGAVTPGSASSAIAVLGLRQRFYRTGDVWSVAFTPSDNPDVRRSSSPAELVAVKRKPVYFDYKVVDVDAQRLARIEVRQRVGENEIAIDQRIDHMILVINPQFVTVRKEIHFRDGRAPATMVTNGQANLSTGFSAYPVDLPTLNSSEGETLREIPSELKKVADFDAKRALDFHASDLYARPVRAIWRDSDLWPVYVKTPAGTSILVSTAIAAR